MLVHLLINGKIEWAGELDEWLAKAKQAGEIDPQDLDDLVEELHRDSVALFSGGAVPEFCLRMVTEKPA